MRQYTILIFCGFILMGCAKVETASNENINAKLNKPVLVSPTIDTNAPLESVTAKVEAAAPLKPVNPQVKLNSEQKKNLNETLPPKVREVLEKSEKFEVLAEVNNEPDGMSFNPNRIVSINDENIKKQILENFYYDASDGPYPSACYVPHHSIRANYQGKTVEIEICFQCHLFLVRSPFGKFEGGLVRENLKSEDFLNQLIQNRSVEIK